VSLTDYFIDAKRGIGGQPTDYGLICWKMFEQAESKVIKAQGRSH